MAATSTVTKAPGKAARPGISDSPTAKKLLIKPGHTIAAINAPEDFAGSLGALPDGATLAARPGANMDAVIAFVRRGADVEKTLAAANKAVKAGGLLWVCYLKGGTKAGTDLNRDILHQQARALGYEGVSLVSFSDAWSAMRFRPKK
ncbi:MAG TPA: hypothetical protein VFX49_20315 [Chloroflexota bacterium]|nr:hypothetical protein [Chloroflexota bacterium]